MSLDDNDLPVRIIHNRDMFDFEGELEEESNNLHYNFEGEPEEVYVIVDLRDPYKASIIVPDAEADQKIGIDVIDYLTRRFKMIYQSTKHGAPILIWGQ